MEYFRGFFGSLSVKIIGVGLTFVSQLIIVKIFSASVYGKYIVSLTIINILSTISMFGLNVYLTKDIASNNYQISESSKDIFSIGIINSFIISILIVAIALNTPTFMGIESSLLLLIIPGVFFFSQNLFYEGLFRGFKRILIAEFPRTVIRPLILLIIIGILTVSFSTVLNEHTLVLTLSISSFFIYLGFLIYSKRLKSGIKIVSLVSFQKYLGLLNKGAPFFFISVTQILSSEFNILIVSFYLSPEETGIFAATQRINQVLNFGLLSSNMILAPMISNYYHSNQILRLKWSVFKASLTVFIFTATFGSLLFLFSEQILMLFGSEFVLLGNGPLRILLIGQLVNSLAGPVGFLMTMTKHQKIATKIMAFSAIINLIVCAIFVPIYGLNGAAWAYLIGIFTWNSLLIYKSITLLKINPTVLAGLAYLQKKK